MKRLLTLLALVLCSCAETFVGEEATRPNNENLPDLTAAFAEEDNTRTYIEDGKYLRWHEDDRLTAFYGNTLNRQYKFNGATGDNSGTFSLVPDGMLGTGNAFDHIYALYPYNADARITDEGVISLTLPAEQNYAENSFGRGANTMLAVTENLEDTFLAFKNACGYLKLKLYNAEGATIKSIEVKGNSGERLAGAATATIAFGEAPVLAMAVDATTSVTIVCGEGVALGTTAETATEFWVTLPATTFAEGLTITATDTEGGVFEKSTTNEVIIERNAIQPMAALCAEFVIYVPKPANNEIWYTNGSTTEPTTPYRANDFDANIISNTYNVEKECWVIKFDGEVTSIGSYAFRYCSSLTSVTIPDSVTKIGEAAFANCSSLQVFKSKFASEDCRCLIIDGTLNSFAPVGLTEYTIPDSVTTIGEWAFCGCHSLTSVTIPDSVTTIGIYAFAYCSSLTSATIPDSVTTIGDYAFYYCSSLTSITIPDGVTTIGGSTFGGCRSLTSVTIPDSVTTIGDDAFSGCSSLPIIDNIRYADTYLIETTDKTMSIYTIKDNTRFIGGYAFSNCDNLTSVTIPDSVTAIGDDAFQSCSSLTSVTMPNRVTTIGDRAFIDCSSLTSVTIPDSVTSIGYAAFAYCTSLTSVTIPDSVTTIGEQAFDGCSSLTSVYCKAVTPPTGGYSMFYGNASGRKIYVPTESVEAYKSASYWRDYADDIVGYDFENGVVVLPEPMPADNEIWYTTTDGAKAKLFLEEYVMERYGITHTYNETLGVWVLRTSNVKWTEFPNIDTILFDEPSMVNSIYLPNCIETIEGALSGTRITSIKLPTNLKTIGDGTFKGCSYLASITIPNGVTSIGSDAFARCSKLYDIVIPNSIVTFNLDCLGCGDYDTMGTRLISLTIGSGVEQITGKYRMEFGGVIDKLYLQPNTPPTNLKNLFYDNYEPNNLSDMTIFVPIGSESAYKQALTWDDYNLDDLIIGINY